MGRRRAKRGGGGLFGLALIVGAVLSVLNWVGSLISPPKYPISTEQFPQKIEQQAQQEASPAQPDPPTPNGDAETTPTPETTKAGYIKGKRVALRSSAQKGSTVIDRLNNGYKVEIIEAGTEWTHVRDPLTRREGWVASHLLTEKPSPETETKKKQSLPDLKKNIPIISDAVIIQKIIVASLAEYDGPCPCPYNRDKRGHSCGKRSAYSRPGGASPVCYPQDVTKQMLQAWRGNP